MIRRLLCWLGWHKKDDWITRTMSHRIDAMHYLVGSVVNSYPGFTYNEPERSWKECRHCGSRRRR